MLNRSKCTSPFLYLWVCVFSALTTSFYLFMCVRQYPFKRSSTRFHSVRLKMVQCANINGKDPKSMIKLIFVRCNKIHAKYKCLHFRSLPQSVSLYLSLSLWVHHKSSTWIKCNTHRRKFWERNRELKLNFVQRKHQHQVKDIEDQSVYGPWMCGGKKIALKSW